MEKHVYLVRHGESDANKSDLVIYEDAILTGKGHEQATLVAERLAGMGIEALVSSTYERALETAEHISERINVPIQKSELFIEIRNPSIRKGLHRADPVSQEVAALAFEGYATPGYRHSDEENARDLIARGDAALDFLIAHEQDTICVVTHGIFMRVLCAVITHREDITGAILRDTLRVMQTGNTNISHFVYKQDPFKQEPFLRWYIEKWNDTTHLQ